MSSRKLNIGMIKNCPNPIAIKAALDVFARPSDQKYGVMETFDVQNNRVEFTMFHSREVTVKHVDNQSGAMQSASHRKDTVYHADVALKSEGLGVLEVMDGSAKSVEVVGIFLAALMTEDKTPEVEFIPLDIESSINKLREKGTKKFELLGCKVRSYEDGAEQSVRGSFAVNFKGVNQNVASNFVVDHAPKLVSVKLKFQNDVLKRPITITLRQSAYFSYSCADDQDPEAKLILRDLAGIIA